MQRVVTFVTGLLLSGLGVVIWFSASEFASIAFALTLLVFGGYVVIASLVPYKNTTEQISDEILGRVLIELPIKLFLRFIGKIGDNF